MTRSRVAAVLAAIVAALVAVTLPGVAVAIGIGLHKTGALGAPARPAPTAGDVPVAYYKASDHAMFTDHASPDRTSYTSSAKPKGFVDPPPGSGMTRYLSQSVTWKGCDEFECAKVIVPLDWNQPDGQAITLALKRSSAASGHAQGTLFINPGGPGASGTDFVTWFPSGAFDNYDVIGWDPRGSGDSTPVVCGTPKQTDAYLDVDASPDTTAEWSALKTSQLDFAKQCRDGSGSLLDHISTIDNVRDLDYLRYLVGDQKLTYLGVSYGTFIGAVYAELYPKRVARMVLDSAVNITDDNSVIQAQGFDLAFKNFATWCAAKKCDLGDSASAVEKRLTTWLDQLDAKPLKVGSRLLTQTGAAGGVASFLYSGAEAYDKLLSAISNGLKGDGEELLKGADSMNGRQDNGTYDSMAYAFPGIGCKDSADDGWAKDVALWPADEKKAPLFGKYFGPPITCDLWSARPADQLDITAKAAAPIVVLGATGDPATPYQQAVSMSKQLDSGVLVTWKGAGHSAFFLGNECVKGAVLQYVNNGVVPKNNTVC